MRGSRTSPLIGGSGVCGELSVRRILVEIGSNCFKIKHYFNNIIYQIIYDHHNFILDNMVHAIESLISL
jgi:hypothetical protein